MTIREFIKAHKNQFDHYRSYGTWKNYKVYCIWRKEDEGAKGYPTFALDDENTIKLSAQDEVFLIMGLER